MDNQKMKQEVNAYLDGHCKQSRPTILGILQNTPCNSQFKAFELYREWIIEKGNNYGSQSEDTKQESKTETQPENQEVENPESISGTKTDN